MALIKGKVKGLLVAFLKEANTSISKNADKSAEAYAEKIEELIYSSIKDITITIPPGLIITTCAAGGGPNLTPIVLEGKITIK